MDRLRSGFRRTETKRGESYTVPTPSANEAPRRPTPAPGCNLTIAEGVSHLVAWRNDGIMGGVPGTLGPSPLAQPLLENRLMSLITSTTVLPALRSDVSFTTSDGFELVGELSLPQSHPAIAAALFLHPLPTAGGFMDSHIIRKAAWRLPALADIAVVRFNFRGVSSPRGTSQGSLVKGSAKASTSRRRWDTFRRSTSPDPGSLAGLLGPK